jgi:hypothetical protein
MIMALHPRAASVNKKRGLTVRFAPPPPEIAGLFQQMVMSRAANWPLQRDASRIS